MNGCKECRHVKQLVTVVEEFMRHEHEWKDDYEKRWELLYAFIQASGDNSAALAQETRHISHSLDHLANAIAACKEVMPNGFSHG